MILRIARKEAIEMTRDGRFRWASAAILLLLAGAVIVGWFDSVRLVQERQEASQAERKVWTTQQDKNPHSAAHYGAWAFKPISVLNAVDRGINPYTGTALFMEGHKVQDAQYRPVDDATALARLGALTAAATLQWLIPLFIILLTFPAFAGERHQGTLRQLMSLGVRPQTLATGKSLGLIAPLVVILAPASALGAAALLLGHRDEWSLSRLLVLAAVYLTYFGLYVGLGLLVSARARTVRTSLLVLIAFWFMNAFLAPRLANDAATFVRPGPNAAAFAASAEQISKASSKGWKQRGEDIAALLMKAHNVDKPEALAVNVPGINLLQSEATETIAHRRLFATLADNFEAQNAVVQAGGIAAPLLAVQSLSRSLTGTDYSHHRHFAEAAESYRLDYVMTLNRDVALNAKPGAQWDGEYKVGSDVWKRIPAFSYEAPALSWALRHQMIALSALALWVMALLALVPWNVQRIRVDEE
ncbi:MAG: DUF3526 domain-containing protein [Myxococcota bacterium]